MYIHSVDKTRPRTTPVTERVRDRFTGPRRGRLVLFVSGWVGRSVGGWGDDQGRRRGKEVGKDTNPKV